MLGPVLNLDIPDNELTSQFEAKLRKTSLEGMLVELLVAISKERPLVMVIEDTHWIDPLSSDLLNVLSRAIEHLPVFLLLVYRLDDDYEDKRNKLADLSYFTEIQLTHLTHEQAEQWINIKASQLYGPDEHASAKFAERLIERADGNPFYIEETLNYLKDNQIPISEVESLDEINLPASLNSLVLSRIDQLAEHPRTTLRIASVFGRSFSAPYLAGTHAEGEAEEEIKSELLELRRKGFIDVESEEDETFLFRHNVIQEVAYESLPFKTRHSLHRTIGDYIESAFEDRLEGQIDLLAYHYFSGESWTKALDYKLDAANQAKVKYANEDVISAAQDALTAGDRSEEELSEKSAKILTAHEILGEVLGIIGEYDDSLRHYGFARSLAASAPSLKDERDSRLAELCHATASVHERRSEFELALEWVERGLERVSSLESSIEEIKLLILKAGLFARIANYDEASSWAQHGLKLALEMPDAEGEQSTAKSYYLLGGIYYRQGSLDLAVDYCERSVEAYEKLDDVIGKSHAYNNLGSTYRLMGDLTLASEMLQKTLEISRQTGDIEELGIVTNNLGNIFLDQEELGRAADHFRESNSVWKRLGAVLPEAITLSNLCEVCIRQGDLEDARGGLERCETLFEQAGSDSFMPELIRRWAQFHLASDDLEQAARSVQESIQFAKKQEAQHEVGLSLRVLAEVELSRGNYDVASDKLRECLAILEEQKSDHEVARARLLEAKLATANGASMQSELTEWAAGTFKRVGAKRRYEEMVQLEEELKERGLLI